MLNKIHPYTLRNGKIIKLRYLFPEELNLLLKIPTTVIQAREIIKRNAGLVRAIFENREKESGIGCPHCLWTTRKHFQCTNCAWQFLKNDLYLDNSNFICCEMTFGGLTLNDTKVCYCAKEETINAINKDYDYSHEKTFLLAHIEWAKAVIAMGGIPWPNGKLTATRQKVTKTS